MRILKTGISILNNILLFTLACFPLFPLQIGGLFIMLWGISALLYWPFNGKSVVKKQWLVFLLLIAPYLALAISGFQTENLKGLEFSLTQKLSFWVFPLGVLATSNQFTREKALALAGVFTLATFIVLIYSNALIQIIGLVGIDSGYLESDLSTNYRKSVEFYSGIHPTYLALYTYFGIFTLLEFHKLRFLFKSKLVRDITYIGLSAMLFILSIPLSARWPLIVFLILIALRYFNKNKWSRKSIVTAIVVSCVAIFSLLQSGSFKDRISETLSTKLEFPVGNNHNSTNVRFGIYNCAIELIQSNWLTGVGIGDTQDELNKCYEQYDTDIYKELNFNTHNTFFNFSVTAGVLGLIALLALYIESFKSYRNWDLAISFLALVIFSSLTENVFDRQLGIVFFCLFNSIFVFTNLREDALSTTE